MDREELARKVREIVADALDRSLSEVTPHASLIDDLGAESIDFLDIVFRLEGEFGLKIPEDEIWKGSASLLEERPEALEERLALLRAKMPGFRWDRFPARPSRKDLPRLITAETIVEYLERVLPRPA